MFDSFCVKLFLGLKLVKFLINKKKKNLKWTFGKATETKSEKEPRLNDSLT